MRWLTFLILVVLVVCLQSTVAPRLTVLGGRPDWVLVLVVFYALHARVDHALPGGWVTGGLADLMSIERFGLLSLSYALAAAAVFAVREWMFTRHPLTHFCVTLAAALAVRTVWSFYRMAMDLPGEATPVLLWSCVYTALWAPLVHWVLLRVPKLLGLPHPPKADGPDRAGLGRTSRQRV